jgi:hypothetical protein
MFYRLTCALYLNQGGFEPISDDSKSFETPDMLLELFDGVF